MHFLLRTLLYSAVGTIAYLAVFYVTFPSDDLRARIMTEARKHQIDLRIGDVKPHGLTGLGLAFDGVSVATMDPPKHPPRKRGRRAVEGDDEEPEAGADPTPAPEPVASKAPFLNLDSARVDVALLPLLRGAEDREIDLDLDADLYGGEVGGDVALSSKRTRVDVEGKSIELARYPITGDDYKIDALGLVNFDVDLDLSKEDIKASTGAVSMDIQGLRILKSSVISAFPLPVELLFTEAVMRLAVAEGKANVDALRLMGDAISVEGDGEVFLNSDLGRSRLKMKVRIKPGPDLQILSAVLSSRARSDDGYYHYLLTGLISNPRFRPDSGAARRWSTEHGGSPSASRAPVGPMDDEGLDDEEEDAPPPDRLRVSKPPTTRQTGAVDKASVPGTGVSDEERDRRREERRKLAEERRQRREERLAKIREAQERTGVSWEDRTKGVFPPFPGDGEAPFRPGIGRQDIPPPNGVEIEGGGEEYIEEDPPFHPGDEIHEDLPEPDVEIVPEGDFEEPPPPDERFDDEPLQQGGDFEEPPADEEEPPLE